MEASGCLLEKAGIMWQSSLKEQVELWELLKARHLRESRPVSGSTVLRQARVEIISNQMLASVDAFVVCCHQTTTGMQWVRGRDRQSQTGLAG
jgi:hypothetical protein